MHYMIQWGGGGDTNAKLQNVNSVYINTGDTFLGFDTVALHPRKQRFT
jgi:hypothetical protein